MQSFILEKHENKILNYLTNDDQINLNYKQNFLTDLFFIQYKYP